MKNAQIIQTSPWLYGLARTRPLQRLQGNATADIAIVGGGIAGVSSAYFILTRTNRSVVLIDHSQIAHGATGNNAGTATPLLEKSLTDFVSMFGAERVKGGLRAIDDAWELLEEIYAFAEGMESPIHLTGYFGYPTVEEVTPVLSENAIRVSLGLTAKEVFFAEERKQHLVGAIADMPGLRFIPAIEIAKHLRTPDVRFTAAVAEHEALVDTASLCEKAVTQLLKQFPERLTIFEDTNVNAISMKKEGAEITADTGVITSKEVILATNGFEKFSLRDEHGQDIDKRFHKNVTSKIGYMLGIFFPGKTAEPASLMYVHSERFRDDAKSAEPGISFSYVTERPYVKDGIAGTLLTIGDPDSEFNHERVEYSKKVPFSRGVQKEMERFLEIHYGVRVSEHETFLWHGLMGYTEKYARLVGEDPRVRRLHYNLGCNGVGILLSMWGGNRLAEGFLGETVPETMYDPAAHFGSS